MTAPGPVPVEQVLAELLASADPLGPVEVPVDQALGRVLARSVTAPRDLPAFDNAAMDGVAVVASDTSGASAAHPARLRLVGSAFAGAADPLPQVTPGTAAVIATGAPLPPGADSIVRVERTTGHEGIVLVHDEVRRGADVRRRGEDLASGDVVVPTGCVLGPGQLAAVAGCGSTQVSVVRRPDVTVLLTGDEVHRGGGDLPGHGLHDAVGPAVRALLLDAGAESVTVEGPVGDDVEALRAAVDHATDRSDLLVTVGGISAGRRDLLPGILADRGPLSAGDVALHPGKPFRHGRVGDTVVTCLPGNPAAALATATLFTTSVVALMGGGDATGPAPMPATLRTPYRQRPGRWHWVRAQVSDGADGRSVRPAPGTGSASLRGLGAANAWMVVPPDVSELAEGDTVDVLPMWGSAGRAAWRTAP